MDEELRIAMQIYMRHPEACKEAAASGSKIALHVQRIVAGMADLRNPLPDLDPARTLADVGTVQWP